ncbi:DUF354 domain-containing protein [Natronorarus salvus]|uniref:DUF354 domain-containing protein n=1 Tax=Natronorarus salvus TaxID=3117733 RepID=UPI002F25FE73
MRVIVTIQHPAHVHFYRHAIDEFEREGHEVRVLVRENEVAVDLLETYGIEYTVLVGEITSLASLARTQFTYERLIYRHAKRFDPDVLTCIGGVSVAHAAALVGAKSVAFTDTEHATIVNTLTAPFADVICTPECFGYDIGQKQRRYPGYHELAYLHPDRFEPDPGVLADAGFDPEERFVVLRVSSWDSSHDVGQGGFSNVREVVERIEDTGARVVVTSEIPLPAELSDRRMSVAPHRAHDLLAYADCFVGEGATMAAESAVLGTPAVYVNTLSMGYTDELDWKYGLLSNFQGPDRHERGLERAVSILDGSLTADWSARRDRLLGDRIDVTGFVVDTLLEVGEEESVKPISIPVP